AIAERSSSEGIMPASESLVALTITMKRMVASPLGFRSQGTNPGSIVTSNQKSPNRQVHDIFFRAAALLSPRVLLINAACLASKRVHGSESRLLSLALIMEDYRR